MTSKSNQNKSKGNIKGNEPKKIIESPAPPISVTFETSHVKYLKIPPDPVKKKTDHAKIARTVHSITDIVIFKQLTINVHT